jgi:hypothetical protein
LIQRQSLLTRHLLVWIAVGIGCGWLSMPSVSIVSLLAFAVSGTIVGFVMGLLTYPFSRQPVLVIVGAVAGTAMGFVLSWQLTPSDDQNLPGLCLMMGSLIGGTAGIWRLPLRIIRLATSLHA